MVETKENAKDQEIYDKLMVLNHSRIRMRLDGRWVSESNPQELDAVRKILSDDEVYKAILTNKFGNGRDFDGWLQHFDSRIIDSEENIKLLALKNPTFIKHVSQECRDDVELMRKCASQAGIHPVIVCYVGEKVKNDFQFIAGLIMNSNASTFDFYGSSAASLPGSDMRYGSAIGLTVQENPGFWMLLNAKIESIEQQEDAYIPSFSVEKELSIVNEKKQNDMMFLEQQTEFIPETPKKR